MCILCVSSLRKAYASVSASAFSAVSLLWRFFGVGSFFMIICLELTPVFSLAYGTGGVPKGGAMCYTNSAVATVVDAIGSCVGYGVGH